MKNKGIGPLLAFMERPDVAVVFDIDGVLAIYEFGELGHSACCDEDWETYVRTHDPYAAAKAVDQIQAFCTVKEPDSLFACSVAQDFEGPGKRAFVLNNYPITEDHISLVESKSQKVAFLEEVAKARGVCRSNVVLVEDSVATLNAAEAEGFTTCHVSSFFRYR